MNVLVVDDMPDTAETEAAVLALHGHAARTAAGGEEALRLAAQDPPDVVLLDIGMPGMDGWELARRLRAQAEAGIDAHLTKPVEPAVLVGLVRRFGRVVGQG
jgi:CheY-like chemotaxis protein